MTVRFLHTADWQLGKPFASLRDETKRARLQQERLQAIQRLAELVRETSPAFVLLAGDGFDSPQVTKATVSAACAAIGAIGVPVIAIPGNHDHGGPGSIWEQEFFRREQAQLAPNLRVLLRREPLVLDSAILFPAPLLRRHESGDPCAWIRQAALDPSLPADRPRLVLAHGSVQDFGSSADEDDDALSSANRIELAALPEAEIDYVALGDWHGARQVGPKAWYPGTPEADRFPRGEGYDPGKVLLVRATRGGEPQVEKWRSGRFDWLELAFRFSDDASLDLLAARLDELIGPRVDERLLRLSLEGSLGIAAAARLEALLESWEARLLRLKLDSQVAIAPSEDEIAALSQRPDDPLISAVATALVARSQGEDEDAAIARLALRELHHALR